MKAPKKWERGYVGHGKNPKFEPDDLTSATSQIT
jgi:hypothetical protein